MGWPSNKQYANDFDKFLQETTYEVFGNPSVPSDDPASEPVPDRGSYADWTGPEE